MLDHPEKTPKLLAALKAAVPFEVELTERLVNQLIALGKPFEFMDYPNRTHAIREGEGTSLHLHALLARFLRENLPAGPRAAKERPQKSD